MTHILSERSVLAFLTHTPPAARWLLTGAFVNQLGFFIQAYLVIYMVAVGFEVTAAGLALTLFGIGSVAGTLAAAPLGARFGDRGAVIAATLAKSASLLALVALLDPAVPLVVWGSTILLCGAFSQMYRPAVASYLSRVFPPEDQVMGFSLLRVTLNLGGVAGPILATALATVDWALVFYVNALCGMIYGVIVLGRVPDDRKPTAEEDHEPEAGWRAALCDARFTAFLAAMLLSSIVFIQFLSTTPYAIEERGLPLAAYSGLLTLYATVVILCELKVSAILERFPSWVAGAIGCSLIGAGIASFALTLDGGLALYLSGLTLVCGVVTSGPSMFAYPARFAKSVRRKRIAATQTAFSAGCAIGPATGLALYDAGDGLVWVFCFVLGIVSAVLCAFGMRATSQEATQ